MDSTCLLASNLEELGPDKVLAVTADSPTCPAGEKTGAQRVAQQLGTRLRIIKTRELDDPRFASNPLDRCYYCKAELFEEIWAIARQEGLQNVVYGATQDDLGDHRPGMRAARELGARAPLLEAGHLGQNVYLTATSMGMGACAVGAFLDDNLNAMLEVDGQHEAAIYMLSIGKV